MRIIRILTIIFLTLFILLNINVYASEKIMFSIDDIKDVEQKSDITLTLKGENFEEANPKPIGIKLDVLYDSNVLEYESAEKGSAVSSTMALHENYTDEGRVRIGILSFTSIDKSGDIYTLHFKVKDNIKISKTDVKIEIAEVSDSSGNEIDTDVKNATISFKGVTSESVDTSEQNSNSNSVSNVVGNSNNIISDESINNNIVNEETVDSIENEKSNVQKIELTNQEKNITDILPENTNLNTEQTLEWKVENPEILEIDKDGNLIPKANGTTKVTVKDENNNEEIITVEVEDQKEKNIVKEKNNNIIIFVITGIIALIIIVFIVIFIKNRRKKEKIKN